MTTFNYKDVKCPNCGERCRVRFTVKTIPFGSTSIEAEKPDKCFYCKNHFQSQVETVYSARKLYPHEKKKFGITDLPSEKAHGFNRGSLNE
jgi:C4-type Zn-finger protein